MAKKAPEIEVKARGNEPPPPLVKRPSKWRLAAAGLFLVLVLAVGSYSWFRTRQAPPPVVMTQVKPGETIGPQKTSLVASAKTVNTNLPSIVTGQVAAVAKPTGGEKPEPPRPGAIRVKVTTPDYAATFLAGASKRLRVDTNAWQTIQTFPFTMPSISSGPCRVRLEVDGFSCSTLAGTNEITTLVEPDRTKEVEFVLTPRPATLTVSCNITNAMIAINNQQSAISNSLSLPSLQPLTLAINAPGYRSQALKLEALHPGAAEQREVKLVRETGSLRIEVTVPDYAKEFLAKTGKRLRMGVLAWTSVPALPHDESDVTCGPLDIALEADGFESATTRVAVVDSRTTDVSLSLSLKPVALIVSCNVSNAVLQVGDQHAAIGNSLFLPALQPLSFAVSATGYVTKEVKLAAQEPGKACRQEVILEPVIQAAMIPSRALGREWPTEIIPLTADYYWAWACRRDTAQGYRQFCSHYPEDARASEARLRRARLDFARAWWDNSRSAYRYVANEHANATPRLAALANRLAGDPALRRVPYPSDQMKKQPLYQTCMQVLLRDLEQGQYGHTDEILGEVRDPAAVAKLQDHLPSKTLGTSIGVARALGAIGDSKAVDALVGVVGRRGLEVLHALGTAGDPRAVDLLLTCVDPAENMHHRSYAANSLGRIGDASAVPALKRMLLVDADESGREDALVSLLRIGDSDCARWARDAVQKGRVIPSSYYPLDFVATKTLVEVAPQVNSDLQVLRLLLLAGDPRAAVAVARGFREALAAKDKDMLGRYQFALDCMEDPVAVDVVVDLLGADWVPPYVRMDAIRCLGRTGDSRAVGVLIKELSGDAGFKAAEALGSIGHSRAVAALSELLQTSPAGHPKAGMLAVSIEALGKIGDPSAIPAITPFSDNPDEKVRVVTAKALGALGGDNSVKDLGSGFPAISAIARVDALGETGSLLTVPYILGGYKDGYFGDHREVLTSLAFRFGPESVINATEGKPLSPAALKILAQAVADGSKLRYESMLLSGMLGESVVPPARIASPPKTHEKDVADPLQWLPRAVPPQLLENLASQDPAIRVLTAKHVIFLLRAQELGGKSEKPPQSGG